MSLAYPARTVLIDDRRLRENNGIVTRKDQESAVSSVKIDAVRFITSNKEKKLARMNDECSFGFLGFIWWDYVLFFSVKDVVDSFALN